MKLYTIDANNPPHARYAHGSGIHHFERVRGVWRGVDSKGTVKCSIPDGTQWPVKRTIK